MLHMKVVKRVSHNVLVIRKMIFVFYFDMMDLHQTYCGNHSLVVIKANHQTCTDSYVNYISIKLEEKLQDTQNIIVLLLTNYFDPLC